MKQRKPAPAQYQPKAEREKEAEVKLTFSPCCVCHTAIEDGYWGRWGNGGVCSHTCNEVMEVKEKEYVDNDGNRH